VRGPDAAGSKNFFAVSGRQGERLQLRLEVWKMNDPWIGLGENLQEPPIFNGKKTWFPVNFPLNQSIEMNITSPKKIDQIL